MSRLNILAKEADASFAKQTNEPVLHATKDFGGNVAFVTLGCAKNQVDSEVMLGVLAQRGFRTVSQLADADLIVINTCGFLQSAVEESIDRILEAARYKIEGRCRRLVVAGCVVERYRDSLAKELPEVDRFLSTDELLSVADASETTLACIDSARRPYFIYDEAMPRLRASEGASAYIKIAEGCNRPCSFCIIPAIRGRLRSRPIESIRLEADQLLQSGVKEINLVAQDLTAYGSDREARQKPLLPELLSSLESLGDQHGPFWIRLLYAYPIGTSDSLLRQIAESPYICSYLDMPLQHISAGVLKAMRRPLGGRGTRALIERIHQVAPSIALRTTFIVGFPGESEADVEELKDFIEEGHFTNVGIFCYSHEEEAPSANLPGALPEEEKQARREHLMKAQQAVVSAKLESKVGKPGRVLVEGLHGESDLICSARAEWQAPEIDGEVLITEVDENCLSGGDVSAGALAARFAGRFVEVEYTEQAGYDIVARLVKV